MWHGRGQTVSSPHSARWARKSPARCGFLANRRARLPSGLAMLKEGASRDRGEERMKSGRKLLIAAVLGGLVAALAACNTVKGVGRDIESVGEAGARAL